ncbi:hypothetical protein G9A89_008594 [Geosiphon pyriformis]|nr:hypothetical protein G9A89_008594 [Geosiphon pyriformis]
MQQQFLITYADKGIQSPIPQPDFGAITPWELSEKEEEGIEPIQQPSQQPNLQIQQPQGPLQQPLLQQQLLQQSQQQLNVNQMAYASITKLENFTNKEDDAQAWINDVSKVIITNNWDNTRALQAISYFLKKTANSCILQHVHPLHPANLQAAVIHIRDFESAELEANYAQAVNLIMNGSSDLNSKLKQISDTINQKIKGYLANNHQSIYQPPQKCSNQGNYNHSQNQAHLSTSANQQWQPKMHVYHNCAKSKHLPANDAAANLSSTSISDPSLSTAATSNISTAVIHNISTAATSNLLTSNHSKTTLKLTLTQNPKTENDTTKLEIGNGCPPTDPHATQNPNSQNYLSLLVTPEDTIPSNPKTNPIQKLISNILPATVTENKTLAAIFPFEFKETTPVLLFSGAALEKKPITAIYTDAKVDSHSIKLILDSGSAGSIITRQLMDQLGCQVDHAASAYIITVDRATKTPIGEIDDFLFKINGIIIPIKVLVMEATQYQALMSNNWLLKTHATLDWTTQELQLIFGATCGHFKPSNAQPFIEFEEETKKPTWEAYQVSWTNQDYNELPPVLFWNSNIKGKQKETELTWISNQARETKNDYNELKDNGKRKGKETTLEETTSTSKKTSGWTSLYLVHEPLPQLPYIPLKCKDCEKKLSFIGTWINNEPCLACSKQLLDEGMWNDIPGREGTCDTSCQYMILINDWVSCGTLITAAWHQALNCLDSYPHDEEKICTTPSEILKIKNNLPELVDIIHIPNSDTFMDKKTEEQKQHSEQLNTQLCDYCLIPCDFQYCNKCDLIYNLLPHMIYTIPEEIEPISSCASELELPFNPNSNSNNDDDKNTGSSSVQIGDNNDDDSNSDSNFDPKYEQYIALPDLSKEQELKWYSNNNKGIMPKHVHNTNVGFDLRYPEKDVIKLEPHSHTCIDLKVALEISATTMVQLAFRSSLAKRGINIKGGIIDTGYVGNIIAMLQNDSEKAYIIEPNEKIAQAIFLPLVKIVQLVLVRNKEELGITARGIQEFGSMGRINIPVNMAEEEIVDQEKIISTSQVIFILLYGQYMVRIKWEVKEQNQIFEAKPTLCKSGEIGLINLHIPAKNYSHIKISIYNKTGNIIIIPAGTTIGYLSTEIEDQPPSTIPDFPQLCGYVDITSQTIYR